MGEGTEGKVVIIDGQGFYKVIDLRAAKTVGLPSGHIEAHVLMQVGEGNSFELKGKKYYLLPCDLYDYIMNYLKRRTQIVYPKEAGYILLKLNLGPGKKVGEGGTGSGALTIIFSRAVGPKGHVYTYERREDLINLIKKNYEEVQEFDNITLHNQLIEDGVRERDLDAFFLDLKEPWLVFEEVYKALKPGGHLGLIVPTLNQISRVIKNLELNNFYIAEALEIMLRNYKLNADRLRPEDVMVGHTGYLVFARKLLT